MKIKELRTERNYTQAQLAEILEISQQNISKYENLKLEPDIASLLKLADYFDVSIDYLVGRTKIRNSNIGTQECPFLSESTLSYEEYNILNLYKSLNAESKLKLQERAETLLDMQEDIMKQKNDTLKPQKGA